MTPLHWISQSVCHTKSILLSLTLIRSICKLTLVPGVTQISWILYYKTRGAIKEHELEENSGSLATHMKELKAGQAE